MKKINLFGVSGGKDSTALVLWAKHDSGYDPETIRLTFCDTGNEHPFTYEQVQWINDNLFPVETITPPLTFYPLAHKKGRFPAAKSRFCTQHLKILPTINYISDLIKQGYVVLSHSGVRGGESHNRSKLEEYSYNGNILTGERRPLISWTLEDVIAYHEKHGAPLNKLYSYGARRVGCFPCVMSCKSEVRSVALNFPERIDYIREHEEQFESDKNRYSSFFHAKTTPKRFHSRTYTNADGTPALDKEGQPITICTIDDVVKWSMTGPRAKGYWKDFPEEVEKMKKIIQFEDSGGCQSGFCE